MNEIILISPAIILVCSFIYNSNRNKKQQEEILIRDNAILKLRKAVEKLMPENPCMMISPTNGIHCMKPASHCYAGLEICEKCADTLIQKGAIPSPKPMRHTLE